MCLLLLSCLSQSRIYSAYRSHKHTCENDETKLKSFYRPSSAFHCAIASSWSHPDQCSTRHRIFAPSNPHDLDSKTCSCHRLGCRRKSSYMEVVRNILDQVQVDQVEDENQNFSGLRGETPLYGHVRHYCPRRPINAEGFAWIACHRENVW